jgi:hypothetical protein
MMTCYKSISLKNFCGCGGIEDTYVRGAYDSNVVRVQVLSTAPFSKLMEFKVAHVVALIAITCVGQKNNSHISLLIG